MRTTALEKVRKPRDQGTPREGGHAKPEKVSLTSAFMFKLREDQKGVWSRSVKGSKCQVKKLRIWKQVQIFVFENQEGMYSLHPMHQPPTSVLSSEDA